MHLQYTSKTLIFVKDCPGLGRTRDSFIFSLRTTRPLIFCTKAQHHLPETVGQLAPDLIMMINQLGIFKSRVKVVVPWASTIKL